MYTRGQVDRSLVNLEANHNINSPRRLLYRGPGRFDEMSSELPETFVFHLSGDTFRRSLVQIHSSITYRGTQRSRWRPGDLGMVLDNAVIKAPSIAFGIVEASPSDITSLYQMFPKLPIAVARFVERVARVGAPKLATGSPATAQMSPARRMFERRWLPPTMTCLWHVVSRVSPNDRFS